MLRKAESVAPAIYGAPTRGAMLDKLDNVHAEDKIVVRNVIAAIETVKAEKILLGWTVEAAKGAYVVSAYVRDDVDCEFSRAELETIHDVNPLRVLAASVKRVAGKMQISVKISDRNEPLMLTETQVLMVRKRSRWT